MIKNGLQATMTGNDAKGIKNVIFLNFERMKMRIRKENRAAFSNLIFALCLLSNFFSYLVFIREDCRKLHKFQKCILCLKNFIFHLFECLKTSFMSI